MLNNFVFENSLIKLIRTIFVFNYARRKFRYSTKWKKLSLYAPLLQRVNRFRLSVDIGNCTGFLVSNHVDYFFFFVDPLLNSSSLRLINYPNRCSAMGILDVFIVSSLFFSFLLLIKKLTHAASIKSNCRTN